jgi:ribose 5-phosphate isomerase B
MSKLTVLVAADPYGFSLYREVVEHLTEAYAESITVEDFGLNEKYYEASFIVGKHVNEAVAHGVDCVRGILCCGSGQGMAVIANRFPFVNACCASSVEQVRGCRAVNNCNILTLGGKVTDAEEAKGMVDAWLTTNFTEGWAPPIREFLIQSMKEIPLLDINNCSRNVVLTSENIAIGKLDQERTATLHCNPAAFSPMMPETLKTEKCRWKVIKNSGDSLTAIALFPKVFY